MTTRTTTTEDEETCSANNIGKVMQKRATHDPHSRRQTRNVASSEQEATLLPSGEKARLYAAHGYNAYVSSKISVERSVNDIRHEQ